MWGCLWRRKHHIQQMLASTACKLPNIVRVSCSSLRTKCTLNIRGLIRGLNTIMELVSLTADCATRSGLRSANGRTFQKPKIRTKFGKRAFSYSGPAAWNSLPDYLHLNNNTASFKRQLRTFLFATAY